MGVPGSSNGDAFHTWAQLPISREQYAKEQLEQQQIHFPECQPLPGVQKLLSNLQKARNANGMPVKTALASSSVKSNYNLKVSRPEVKAMLDHIPEEHRILGDDPRVKKGRGKPAPDIYLLALQTLNSKISDGEPKITPEECLVFEDSVPGVEAGRRAGMRVLWVPHVELFAEWKSRTREVLAGRTGLVKVGDEDLPDDLDEGWGEHLTSLEDFPYETYGILAPS